MLYYSRCFWCWLTFAGSSSSQVTEQAVTIERLEREMVEKRHRLSQVELAAKEYSKPGHTCGGSGCSHRCFQCLLL